jgi:hypothetical protein
MQAQIEALYNLSILYNRYPVPGIYCTDVRNVFLFGGGFGGGWGGGGMAVTPRKL